MCSAAVGSGRIFMTVSEKAPSVPCDTGMGPSASLSATPGSDGGDIDARMKAAGMIPLSDLISGNTPLERWAAHTGVSDLDTFEEWLTRKQREFGVMKAGYELGDKDKGDELYEWVLSHFAAFNEVAANLRQMKERMAVSDAAGGETVPLDKYRTAVLSRERTILEMHDKSEAVIAGLNKQLTEQFDLTTKLAAQLDAALGNPASSPVCNLVPPPETRGGSPDEPWTGGMPLPQAGEFRNWKTLAIGMGAHLEQLETHCSVQTGKTGSAHADEGRELREAGKAFVAMVRSLIACRSERGDGLHPETEKLVAEFSFALRAKLLKAQQKYEFGDDWRTDDWETECRQSLFKHLIKGDPLDVGAYAAFCWKRGWTTSPPESNYGPSYKVLEDQLAIAMKSLQRIRDADHRNTNSSTAPEAFAYAHAVTAEALDAIAAVTEARS